MTAAVLPDKANQQVAFFTTQSFGPTPKKGHWYAKDDGTKAYRLERVPIFRSGEFRDSMGYDHLYESIHMQMIASNFSLLRSSGSFPDPPIRCNHPGLFSGGGLDQVIGYVDNLIAEEAVSPVDGQTYTYVMADYDVLDEEAANKIASGLWRHRSAEIGWYETNSKSEFWPVLVGFAYVDIPAVEGLNFSKYANGLPGIGTEYVAVSADNKEEGQVADDNTNPGGQANHGAPNGQTNPPTPPPPVVGTPAPHVFKIAGSDSSDFAAVQAHILKIEGENAEHARFQAETVEAGRIAFIKSLSEGDSPKIFAAQVAGLTDLVKTMSGEQFGQFKAAYESAPGIPTLTPHVVSSDAYGTSTEGDKLDPEVEQARRIYNRHQLSGMPASQLAETPSAKILKEKGLI